MAKTKRNRQLQLRIARGWRLDYLRYMSGNAWKTYTCIADYCDWQTGKGCPTFKRIATEAGISERSVRRAVHELADMGLLTYEFRKAVNKKGKEYGRKRYFYQLTHPPTKDYFRSDNQWKPIK